MSKRELAIGLIAAVALVTGLAVFWLAGAFGRMFADFGDPSLPLVTQVFLSPWFPAVDAVVVASPAVLAIVRPERWKLAIGLAIGLTGVVAIYTLCAAYAPIFELAGNVSSE